jgi:hypothetical protein
MAGARSGLSHHRSRFRHRYVTHAATLVQTLIDLRGQWSNIDRVDATAIMRDGLALLRDKQCWSILAGAGTGSTMHLEFGAKVLRITPLRPRLGLTLEQMRYEGEIDLFVQCAWRLERSQTVLCGSTDADRNDGPMVQGLKELAGRTVLAAEIERSIPDLTVSFDGGLRLKVFCDQTNLVTNDDNYSLRVGGTIYAVGARGRILIEKRRSD